jgi:broad specificity phosphatase PhoE
MRLFVARHMETIANRKGMILGRGDSPPTRNGYAHCNRLASSLRDAGEGIIFSSPLGRALLTAERFVATTGWTTVPAEGLMELSCGAWEGQPRLSVLQPEQPLRSTWDDAPGGGESCAKAAQRVEDLVHRLRRQAFDNILVVGHAAVNQVFLKVWLSLDIREALAIQHPHDLLYEIDAAHISWRSSSGATGEGLLIKR